MTTHAKEPGAKTLRYDCDIDDGMRKDATGEFVTHLDYEILQRELAALKAGVARMQEDYSVLQMLYRASINAAVVDPNVTKELTALRATAEQLARALEELVDIVEGAQESNDGKEALDSFTCQPAKIALTAARELKLLPNAGAEIGRSTR
jgi:hypothetical protein